jgi:toxin ParE1/3/4
VKVIIRESVVADLKRIRTGVAKDSLVNARSVIERILSAIETKIPAFPYIGRKGKVEGTREWIVRGLPYIILYEVDDAREVVIVLAVFHGAQNR